MLLGGKRIITPVRCCLASAYRAVSCCQKLFSFLPQWRTRIFNCLSQFLISYGRALPALFSAFLASSILDYVSIRYRENKRSIFGGDAGGGGGGGGVYPKQKFDWSMCKKSRAKIGPKIGRKTCQGCVIASCDNCARSFSRARNFAAR